MDKGGLEYSPLCLCCQGLALPSLPCRVILLLWCERHHGVHTEVPVDAERRAYHGGMVSRAFRPRRAKVRSAIIGASAGLTALAH